MWCLVQLFSVSSPFFFVFLYPALLQSHRNAFHVLAFSHPFSKGEQARMLEEIF